MIVKDTTGSGRNSDQLPFDLVGRLATRARQRVETLARRVAVADTRGVDPDGRSAGDVMQRGNDAQRAGGRDRPPRRARSLVVLDEVARSDRAAIVHVETVL